MNAAIDSALQKLRNPAGWWEGDAKAREVLGELLEAEACDAEATLRTIAAALSFSPAVDRDLETCARRIYHQVADLTSERDYFKEELAKFKMIEANSQESCVRLEHDLASARLAGEAGAHDKTDAKRYQFLRSEKLSQMLAIFPTDETCDVGLDYAIDLAIASTAQEGK